MLKVRETSRFKKDLKRMRRQRRDMTALKRIIAMLVSGEHLPARMRDHPLVGSYAGYRECHISPDWLLIYKIENDMLILTLLRTGSHAELFGK